MRETPQRAKLVDAFMAFLVAVGGLQFLYVVLVGNYVCPFFSFLLLLSPFLLGSCPAVASAVGAASATCGREPPHPCRRSREILPSARRDTGRTDFASVENE